MAEILKKKEIHVFNRFGHNLAFDVNDMLLFEINQITKEIFQQVDGKTPDELTAVLSDHFPSTDVLHVMSQLLKLNMIGYQPAKPVVHDENPQHGEDSEDVIKRLVLFVTQDCNLKCRYCFTQAKGSILKKYMNEETAKAAVGLLFKESKNAKDLRIGFYGGEPMLQFALIKKIIPYANQKAQEFQKNVQFNMTTNGTLLTDEAIQFIVDNKIRTTVSLDGGREIHDKNRVFSDGSGSFASTFPAYTRLKKKVKETATLAIMNSFDVPMKEIAQSLLDSGIQNVRIAPAISSTGQLEIPIREGESCDNVEIYNREYEELVRYLLEKEMIFQENPPLDFSRVFGYLDKREKRFTDCGAAYARIAVDAEGNILPCDNFIGESDFYMGNVLTGIDKNYGKTFKEMRAVNNEVCRVCWVRYLCGGWCPFFSFKKYDDLKKPVNDQCRLKKNYFEIDMAVYSLFKNIKKTMSQNQN